MFTWTGCNNDRVNLGDSVLRVTGFAFQCFNFVFDSVDVSLNYALPVQTLYLKVNYDCNLRYIGARRDVTRHADFTIYNVGITGKNYWAVDDGPTAGGVIVDSVGVINGTLVNEITGDWYEAPI